MAPHVRHEKFIGEELPNQHYHQHDAAYQPQQRKMSNARKVSHQADWHDDGKLQMLKDHLLKTKLHRRALHRHYC